MLLTFDQEVGNAGSASLYGVHLRGVAQTVRTAVIQSDTKQVLLTLGATMTAGTVTSTYGDVSSATTGAARTSSALPTAAGVLAVRWQSRTVTPCAAGELDTDSAPVRRPHSVPHAPLTS